MSKASTSSDIQPLLIRDLITPKEIFRSIRNYLAGQFVGATRDDVLLDELLKCLFCKLYAESSGGEAIPVLSDSFEQARVVRGVFAQVRRDFPDIFENDAEILLDPDAISHVLRECTFDLADAASDPIGDAFEVFVGSESRGRSGQFFTPRPVTDLLVEALDPQPGETIIDPACGAGGFLTAVGRHFRSKGLTSGEVASLASTTFYGVDKDEYLVKLARLHVSLLSKGHPHVICGDSIALKNGATSLKDHFPAEGFDVILTNPPFGAKIVAATPEVLRGFSLARKWVTGKNGGQLVATNELQSSVPPQVLFVERCLSLLKEGGRLGIVLPESLLSNKSYRYVVEYILTTCVIRGIIGMPEALFKTSGKGGTHTKTCLLIAEKNSLGTRTSHQVFMAEAKWCGHDSRARNIPNNDLPRIADNYADFREGILHDHSCLGFVISAAKITANVLCPRYYDPQLEDELLRLEETHRLIMFRDLVADGTLEVATGHELGKLAYGTGEIPFIRTSDISNWELKADPKHMVDRKIYEAFRGKQDVRADDILMVKDGTYLVGSCALISEYDTEIVYQSHLYKIRVKDNQIGLDPYLLLAILDSPIVKRQIKNKQFTQDIIDSLGERINELVLPVPRSEELRNRVSQMVRSAIHSRIEARELARQARTSVVGSIRC